MPNYVAPRYDLDYYTLFLQKHLHDHHFPEVDDELFIATRADQAYDVFVASRLAGDEWITANEKAMAALYAGFEISPYDFIYNILVEEFYDHISLDERSLEYWTNHFLEELTADFKEVSLSEDFLNTTEGAIFKLTVIGRISELFDSYGL